MRLRGALNGMRRAPLRTIVGLLLLGAIFVGELSLTRRGVRFLDAFPDIGTIADSVARRSLEALFLVLMVGVAFSVLTGAIATLYDSTDLPFLLSLPVAPWRVFGLKMIETYVTSAMVPAAFTLPVLVGLGIERHAPVAYYPISLLAILALYALPVALGAVVALLLMRAAPAGRAKEVSTAASVVLAAGLVVGLRALRPERLSALTPEQFEGLLSTFARLDLGPTPAAWAAGAVWDALGGKVSASAAALAVASLVALLLVARLAALAYRAGWFRALDAGRTRRAVGFRPAALWEKPLAALGAGGGILVKDLRLLARDPSQWVQLLVLLALAGVYFISTAALAVDVQRFRDVLGAMNLAFLGFLVAGVGVRMALPLVSLEGEGFWLLQTGPVRSGQVVAAKFWGVLPLMSLLGVGVGLAVASRLGVSPQLAFATPIAGLCAAFAISGLGVGLGAAFPRFDATNPAEIPMSTGGLLYMGTSLLYAALSTLLFAYPVFRVLRAPGMFRWASTEGVIVLGLVLALTTSFTLVPLLFGARRLGRYESGRA